VHRALGTGGLAFLKGAESQTLLGIALELLAVGAQPSRGVTVAVTIDLYHGLDGLFFTGHSRAMFGHKVILHDLAFLPPRESFPKTGIYFLHFSMDVGKWV
jgi:hypothetical protein